MAIVLFGDSNTSGHGVSSSSAYPALLSDALSEPKTVIGNSGHMAADQSWRLYPVLASDENIYTIMLGTNDAQHYGTNATKRQAFINFMRAIMVWCTSPSKVIARSGPTLSGAWSNTPVNSIGLMTTTANSTLTATVTGSTVYVGYILQNLAASEGIFEVRVDGVLKATVSTNGTAIGNTLIGQPYAPACLRISGLSDEPHVLQIKSLDSRAVFIEWVAGSTQPSAPKVYVGNVIKRSSAAYGNGNSDANVQAYNTAIVALIAELASDGKDIRAVDTYSVIVPATHLQADGIHLNSSTGHPAIKDAFLSVIDVGEPPEHTFSPVQCYVRDDGKFFIGEGAQLKEIMVI